MKIAIGQFGGPTTVFNASLYGALSVSTSPKNGATMQSFGLVGGVAGLLEGQLAPISSAHPWLLDTPGAALGSGRFKGFAEVAEIAVKQLQKQGIDGFLAMGGNGTMALAKAVEDAAKAMGAPLQVMGVPKTIDNDLVQIDHSPGYPSAARFVIKAVRDLTIDLEAMKGFEQVRVVEVMGRRGGWLAAAAALVPHLAQNPSQRLAPFICLPEQPLCVPELLEQIRQRVADTGSALVVISEGVQDDTGHAVLQSAGTGSSADTILGGIGAQVAERIRQELGYRVRYENLGLLQRCWAESQSTLDREEAVALGRAGAAALLSGQSGKMVGYVRQGADTQSYATELIHVPLEAVAGKDRILSEAEQQLTDEFLHWLIPLVDLPSLEDHPRLPLTVLKS